MTQGYTSSASITRTADTNAYTAGDVIGAATGSTAAVEFVNIAPPSGDRDVLITSTELEIDASAVPSGMTSFNLYLYSATPPGALGDNAAFDLSSGDRASFLGKISLGTPVDEGSTLYVSVDGINKHIRAASRSLFGYLVTVGGYTPASGTVHKITLHTIPVA
jgi:hypothetical protein